MRYFVKKENKEDTIQKAINKAEAGDVIIVGPGIYREKVHIKNEGISIIGSTQGETVIIYDDCAKKKHSDGEMYGTFLSYTLLVEADNVHLKHLTIVNDAGDGDEAGQAIALYLDGDCIKVESCQLIGCQDTLFIAPLPEKPRIPNSFKGPSEGKHYRPLHSYFFDVVIQGDIDFIFGSGKAVFHQCRMLSNNREQPVNGYVCAPSTRKESEYGFVFIDCIFEGPSGIKTGTVFLARPWRPYGKVDFHYCKVGNHVHPELIDDWNDKDNRETATFRFYNCLFEDFAPTVDEDFVEINDFSPITALLSKWHIACISANGRG